MQLTETVLVVFVIILILIVGVVVYFRYSAEKVRTMGEELSEREASIMLVKAVGLDELGCDAEDCMDVAKFLAFKRAVGEDFERFRRIFGSKKISVRLVYPVPDELIAEQECDVAHYIQVEYPENCGVWSLYEHNPKNEIGRKVSSLVSLYFPEFDEYMIGRLEIEHYGTIQ